MSIIELIEIDNFLLDLDQSLLEDEIETIIVL